MIKGSRFHHIGYAVKDIIETAENYISMGWVLSEVYVDVIQNSQIAFLKKEGFPLIELVAAVDDKSPVVNTLKKSGVSPYHVCYEVDDIDIAIKELNEMSFFTMFDPIPNFRLLTNN